MSWLTPKLREKVKKFFELRYDRQLTELEVEAIAENLTSFLEVVMKYEYEQKYGNTSK